MLSDLLRWGGKRPGQPDASGKRLRRRAEMPSMPSKAFPKLLSAIAAQPDPAVLLDFGPVIGSNVAFFGERLGCKLFIEDLFAEFDRHSRAGTLDDLAKAFDTALPSRGRQRRRHAVLGRLRLPAQGGGPGAGPADHPDAASGRRGDGLLLHGRGRHHRIHQVRNRRRQPVAAPATRRAPAASKHVLANRDIIRMFDGLIVSDSFLLKSNTREILLRRKS